MNDLVTRVQALVDAGDVRLSEHGYDELANDGLSAKELLAGVMQAAVVETYPNYPKGPCVLLLQADSLGNPVHAVWGIPRERDSPAVLVTAYRPDPERWHKDFTTRR